MKQIFIILLLLTQISGFAQEKKLIPFRKGEKWGFSNKQKELVIKPIYQQVTPFKDGFSTVHIDGKSAIINQSGKYVISPDSNAIMPIESNLFIIARRDKSKTIMGLMNEKGNFIIPQKYKSIRPKNNCLELENQSRKIGVSKITGEIIIPVEYDHIRFLNDELFVVSKENQQALFDLNGVQLTGFEYMVIGEFRHGLSKVRKGDYFGYINQKGKLLTEIKYEMNYAFSEGFAVVKINNKYGLIDTLGNVKIQTKYDLLNDIHLGIASFKKENKWGLVNSKGEELTQAKYQEIKRVYKGVIAAKLYGKWGIVSPLGEELTAFEFEEIEIREKSERTVRDFGVKKVDFDEGYLLVSKNNKWGLVDLEGKLIIPTTYDYIYQFTNGIAIVKQDEKYGLTDTSGSNITEVKYDGLEPYLAGSHSLINLGVMIYKSDDKQGIIRKDGKEITTGIYDYIIPTDSKYFIVFNNRKAGVLDIETGKELIPCKYDKIKKQGIGFDRFVFLDDIAIVLIDRKMGFINKEGIEYFE